MKWNTLFQPDLIFFFYNIAFHNNNDTRELLWTYCDICDISNIWPFLLKQVSSSHNTIFLYASHHIGIHKYLQSLATDWQHSWNLLSVTYPS